MFKECVRTREDRWGIVLVKKDRGDNRRVDLYGEFKIEEYSDSLWGEKKD